MGKFYAEVEGMLVTEPESRTVSGDRVVMSARLATTERKKNKEGEWENGNTIFLTVVDFNESLMDFVKKDIVVVKGRVSLNKWTGKDGTEREEWKLFADEITEFTHIPRT